MDFNRPATHACSFKDKNNNVKMILHFLFAITTVNYNATLALNNRTFHSMEYANKSQIGFLTLFFSFSSEKKAFISFHLSKLMTYCSHDNRAKSHI